LLQVGAALRHRLPAPVSLRVARGLSRRLQKMARAALMRAVVSRLR